jgi:hypothetical protein
MVPPGTDKSGHTHTHKEHDTRERERHTILIFDIFDVNLWFFFPEVSGRCSVATAQPGPPMARLRVLGHKFGDGPGADLIAYGLGAAVSRPGRPKPCWDCHFWV